MDRIMSTSIILLDQTLNANDVDIMKFELSFLFPPVVAWEKQKNIWPKRSEKYKWVTFNERQTYCRSFKNSIAV